MCIVAASPLGIFGIFKKYSPNTEQLSVKSSVQLDHAMIFTVATANVVIVVCVYRYVTVKKKTGMKHRDSFPHLNYATFLQLLQTFLTRLSQS